MTEIALLKEVINLLKSEKTLNQRYAPTILDFERQLTQANLDRYRIGVIGVTSSGKSTMINAILGDDLLCMAVKPSSSQLVTCSKSSEKKATIYFENQSQLEYKGKSLTAKIIQKYSDENYNQKNKEQVKQLELSTPNFALPEEILLVDSPGLDAYGLEGHERLTMNNLLPTIDFCIFVTTFKTNSDDKMRSVLNTIAEYNCPVIIVQNMLDSVKPSPDGRKSSIDVANEHKLRVEKIVNNSKITNKSNVRIVQISSKLALEGRIENNPAKIQKSNYNKLVSAVCDTLNVIKPKIEAKRIDNIKKRIDDLICEAMQDISSDAESNKTICFEFNGLDEELREKSTKIRKSIETIIEKLVNRLEIVSKEDTNLSHIGLKSAFYNIKPKHNMRNDHFNEKEIDSIKALVSQSEESLLAEMKMFNSFISSCCKKLGVDERRLRIIDSFGEVPGLKIQTQRVKHYREKEGIGNSIARFFGDLFGQDWGYEEYYNDEFDEEATRKKAIEYLVRVINMYSQTCEKWLTNSENVLDEIDNQIELRRQAFEARKMQIEDEKAVLKIVNKLKSLSQSIIISQNVSAEKVIHTDSDMDTKMMTAHISNNAITIYNCAVKIISAIHKQIMLQFGIDENDCNIIVSWDAFCTSMLLKNSFGIYISEENLGSGLKKCQNLNTYIAANPDASILYALMNNINSPKRNWLILFNATQYGSALKSLNNIRLSDVIEENDRLFLVVQDFEELRNGGGVKEALRNMKSICNELGLTKNAFIILNDNNPIYSLTALQAQLMHCKTHADEILLLDFLKKHFSFLISRQSEKTLDAIIQAL